MALASSVPQQVIVAYFANVEEQAGQVRELVRGQAEKAGVSVGHGARKSLVLLECVCADVMAFKTSE